MCCVSDLRQDILTGSGRKRHITGELLGYDYKSNYAGVYRKDRMVKIKCIEYWPCIADRRESVSAAEK